MNESTAHVMVMNSYFDFVYAKALYEQLGKIVKQECYGCEVDHPSQVQHSCVMHDSDEHVGMYFDLLLAAVNEDLILLSWSEIMESLNICPELLAMQKLKIYDRDWLETMKNEQWQRKMQKMVLSILHIEHRLFQPNI